MSFAAALIVLILVYLTRECLTDNIRMIDIKFRCLDPDSVWNKWECRKARLSFVTLASADNKTPTSKIVAMFKFQESVTISGYDYSFYHLSKNDSLHVLGFLSRFRNKTRKSDDLFEGSLYTGEVQRHISYYPHNMSQYMEIVTPKDKKFPDGEEEDDEVKAPLVPEEDDNGSGDRGIFSWPSSPVVMKKATIEVAILVENAFIGQVNRIPGTMNDTHRIEKLIRHVMNAAAAILAQVEIRVKIVDIRYLSEQDSKMLLSNMSDYVSFLRRMTTFFPNFVSHTFNPDAILTFVNRSIESDNKSSSLLGKTFNSQICTSLSHALILWRGRARTRTVAGFARTTAHELVHLIGVSHVPDNQTGVCKCCIGKADNNYCLMKIRNPFFNGMISKCSRERILNKTSRKLPRCLFRKNVLEPDFDFSPYSDKDIADIRVECENETHCQTAMFTMIVRGKVVHDFQVVAMTRSSGCDHYQNVRNERFLFIQVCGAIVNGIFHHKKKRTVIRSEKDGDEAVAKVRFVEQRLEDAYVRPVAPRQEEIMTDGEVLPIALVIAVDPVLVSHSSNRTTAKLLFIGNLLVVMFSRIGIPLRMRSEMLEWRGGMAGGEIHDAIPGLSNTTKPDIILVHGVIPPDKKHECPFLIPILHQNQSLDLPGSEITIASQAAHEIALSFGISQITSNSDKKSCSCNTYYGSCIMDPEIRTRGVLWSGCSVREWRKQLSSNKCAKTWMSRRSPINVTPKPSTNMIFLMTLIIAIAFSILIASIVIIFFVRYSKRRSSSFSSGSGRKDDELIEGSTASLPSSASRSPSRSSNDERNNNNKDTKMVTLEPISREASFSLKGSRRKISDQARTRTPSPQSHVSPASARRSGSQARL